MPCVHEFIDRPLCQLELCHFISRRVKACALSSCLSSLLISLLNVHESVFFFLFLFLLTLLGVSDQHQV